MKTFKSIFAAGALVLGIGMSGPASADTFALANSNGGDGYVTAISGGFDLFGANNGSAVGFPNYTTYLASATINETLTFNWTYTSHDCCGSSFDPAGYVVGSSYTQLSNEFDHLSGAITLSLLAGQSYGFYVYSTDSTSGRADIAVTATPLPAALPLFASGIGALGLLGWRRKRKALAA